ncbi:MAG: protein kinase, partial [Planctomycetales bacterium]|nr:protein kinase [Planctomycetales bacterium]
PFVKVLDLGLATIQDQADELHLTDAGQLMGTLEYMAPEQAEDTHGVDHRADIYALGVTLYRLLTGHLPFSDREYPRPAQRLRALTQSTPPSVATQREGLPRGLIEIVDQMLARDPAARPSSMQEVATRLEEFSSPHRLDALLDQEPLGANPEPQRTDQPHATPSEQVRSETSHTLAAGRPHKRHFFILIVLLLLSVSAGIMWVRSHKGHIEIKSVDSSAKPVVDVPPGASSRKAEMVADNRSEAPVPPQSSNEREDNERELARQIIASGGAVVFVDAETGNVTARVSQVEDIPHGRITIRNIDWNNPDARRFSDSGRLSIQMASGQPGMTNEAIGHLTTLLAPCKDLRHLGLQTPDDRVTDDAVKHLGGLSQLTFLMVGFPLLTDNGIDRLTDNTTLKELWVVSPRFTDRIWVKLAAMEHLESITISAAGSDQRMWLTGVGITVLRDHPKLKKLSIQSCKLSDVGVREIGQLTQLEHLDLYNTSLNDEQIRHLADLRGLKSLGVLETQVTQTGVGLLERALPDCLISSTEP